MLNKIIVMGRLGRDPEVRYTSTGKPVASFTLAVDRDFKGQDGRRETDWLQIVAWDAKARFAQQYFHKGQQALVEIRRLDHIRILLWGRRQRLLPQYGQGMADLASAGSRRGMCERKEDAE